MINKIKECFYKWLAKDMRMVTFTKYKVEIEYTNDEIEIINYDKYSRWSNSFFIEFVVLNNDKRMYIKNGVAIPLHQIRKIKAIPIDKKKVIDTYNISSWLTLEEINKCNYEDKNIIKYIKGDE